MLLAGEEVGRTQQGNHRGHIHPHRFRVWISGQVRRVTKAIRREMPRRAAVEPEIGHLKDHRMRRNYLKGRQGDRTIAVLAAGFNFNLLRAAFFAGRLPCHAPRGGGEAKPACNSAWAPSGSKCQNLCLGQLLGWEGDGF